MNTCIAKDWYERTRNLSAFTVTGYTKKHKNQYATVYTFQDGSQFIAYKVFGTAAYRRDGYIMAKRNLPKSSTPQSA